MFFPACCRSPRILVPAAFLFGALAGAQTLEQRPAPAQPEPHRASVTPELPKGTSLQVATSRHYPVKVGEPIEAHLMHPIFADGKLVVPQNTILEGRVTALLPDSKIRWHARLRGDFTPYHNVQVQFDKLVLPTGAVPIDAAHAANGAPVLRLTAPGVSPKQSFLARHWSEAKANLHDRIAFFTAPGKGDRALQCRRCRSVRVHNGARRGDARNPDGAPPRSTLHG